MGMRVVSIAFRWLSGIGLLAMLGIVVSATDAQDVPPPVPTDPNQAVSGDPNVAAPAQADPNGEVLTRGPVHEAYAVPLSAGQTTGMIVPKQPAAPIEEVPPDMKPEGGNSVWIPGYWSWDDERRDFLWVSGVWRAPPPGYRWMPGYWQAAPGQGYQWVSGYWMPARLEEATFLPQPPQSIEAGPTSAQPGGNFFWIGGHWQWVGTHYVWQPGYWSACQPDWVWVPASYYWCPRGWVYVPGYWDYPLARRGLAFSPVYFAGPVAVYRPAVCLDVGAFSISLFARPAYCHYYFGDYYDDRYVAWGIRPWFYYSSPRFGYDPLYTYYRWYHVEHLGERQWDDHLRGWHEYYRGHPDMRPPHTLAEERALLASPAGRNRPDLQQLRMAHDIHQAGGARLQAVSAAERAQLHQAARETVRFGAERQQLERSGGGAVHGQAERVSLNQMSSFKSAQLPGASPANTAISRSVGGSAGPGAGNPGVRTPYGPGAPGAPGGNTAAGAAAGRTPTKSGTGPGKSNSREKDREKKPQASTAPAVTPTAPATINTATSKVAASKPQPQTHTVMRVDPGNAGSPPPRTNGPPSHAQPPANNNSGGRVDSRNDDKRAREKESRPQPPGNNTSGGRNEDKRGREKDKDAR